MPAFPAALFLAVLALLLALDALSTVYALTHFGVGRAVERNGVLGRLMGELGMRTALFVAKLACFVLAVWLISEIHLLMRWAIVALYLAVVANNVVQIYRLRKAA